VAGNALARCFYADFYIDVGGQIFQTITSESLQHAAPTGDSYPHDKYIHTFQCSKNAGNDADSPYSPLLKCIEKMSINLTRLQIQDQLVAVDISA
jgi:hypothetical protein